MSTQTQLQEVLLSIVLHDMGATLDDVKHERNSITDAINKLTRAIEKVDLNTYIKDDVMDVASIRRRLKRIEFLTGENPRSRPIMKSFEEKLDGVIRASYSEIVNSDMYKSKCNVTIWDLMTFFPQLRSEGVKIMKSVEEDHKIPKALYTTNQVKNIDALGRIFDTNTIKLMDDTDFRKWTQNRETEFERMYNDCSILTVMKLIYELVAKASPEYFQEKQLPFITEIELRDILHRIMAEERKNKDNYTYKQSYYPFVDRCLRDRLTVTDRFIEIILRGLIV